MASEPLPPLPGSPGLEPGWVESTTPELSLFPPAPLGGARTEPTSPGPPRPEPCRPKPESPAPEPTEGGGGTMLLASKPPLPEPPEFREAVPEVEPVPAPETDGGGGMTFDPPREEPCCRPEPERPEPEAAGGGGITLEFDVP